MTIYRPASYRVRAESVKAVKNAIVAFVAYAAVNEPDCWVYKSWRRHNDPTQFVHIFEFSDESVNQRHGDSEAV